MTLLSESRGLLHDLYVCIFWQVRDERKVFPKLLSDADTQPAEHIISLTDRQPRGRPVVMQSGTDAQPLVRAWSMLVAILLLTILVGSMLLILSEEMPPSPGNICQHFQYHGES